MDGAVFSIPSYSEYYSWTAATDLYSIGAIALYCPFMNANLFISADHSSGGKPSLRRAEEQFDEFFQLVTNEEYFRVVWDQLSCFRHTLKQLQDEEENSPDGIKVSDVVKFTVSSKGGSKAFDYAKKIVREIVQVVPHVRALLLCFPAMNRNTLIPDADTEDGPRVNMGDFLLYMYFAMGCIHRKSHFVSPAAEEYRRVDPAPFCQDRFEKPIEVNFDRLHTDADYEAEVERLNAVSRSKTVLEKELKHFLKKNWMRGFDIPLSEIPERSGEMSHQALLDKLELERTQKAWRERAKDLVSIKSKWFEAILKDERGRKMQELIDDIAKSFAPQAARVASDSSAEDIASGSRSSEHGEMRVEPSGGVESAEGE